MITLTIAAGVSLCLNIYLFGKWLTERDSAALYREMQLLRNQEKIATIHSTNGGLNESQMDH